MRHRIEEIERLAMTGCGLPEGYSQPEQLLFLSLRILHWEFRNRIIGREQAGTRKNCWWMISSKNSGFTKFIRKTSEYEIP